MTHFVENVLMNSKMEFVFIAMQKRPQMNVKNVVLYTRAGCPTCRVFTMKMEKKGIPFTKVEDEEKLFALGQEHHIQSAPILCVDGTYYDAHGAKEFIDHWEN